MEFGDKNYTTVKLQFSVVHQISAENHYKPIMMGNLEMLTNDWIKAENSGFPRVLVTLPTPHGHTRYIYGLHGTF